MNLYKGEYNADIQPAERTEPQQEIVNLIENANFEVGQAIPRPGWGTWNPAAGDGSTATIIFSDSVDGSGSCRIDPKGSANGDFYLIAKPLNMEVSETYTLSYWAKAAEPRSIGTQIKGNDNSGPPFCNINPELTTEWAEYTATDVCTQPVCKLDIASGGTISVWLDFMHLYKGEYVEILPGGRKLVSEEASNPNPTSGGGDVPHDTTLTWTPGEKAVTNNVYLGTSFDDVNNADANSVLLVSAAQDANSYDPNALGFDTTYYWRIDGISDTGEVVKGMVWNFTTRDYIGIDDFEDYSATNQIWWTWKDGLAYVGIGDEPNYPGNGTGSAVGNENTASFTEETIVNGGDQSMPIYYDNDKQGYANYSETTRTFETPQDWAANGVTTLTLFFHGWFLNEGNMYIKINDTKIPYVGPGDNLKNEQWIQMYIDLADVAALGADLTNVTSLTIGIEGDNAAGRLYVDDIRILIQMPEIPALGADKPVIDGQIDALWDAAEAHPIDTLRDGVALESELDCSGTIQILWDAENLYVLVEVNEEALVQDSADGWLDDRIEIFIDADGSKTTGGPGFQGTDGVNDYQYCFSWTPDAVPPVEWYFNNDPDKDSMAGVVSSVAVTEGGYRIEVKLPWSTLLGAVPSAGHYIGIALVVDDDDDGSGRDSQVTALMSGGGSPHRPNLWATVRLME